MARLKIKEKKIKLTEFRTTGEGIPAVVYDYRSTRKKFVIATILINDQVMFLEETIAMRNYFKQCPMVPMQLIFYFRKTYFKTKIGKKDKARLKKILDKHVEVLHNPTEFDSIEEVDNL